MLSNARELHLQEILRRPVSLMLRMALRKLVAVSEGSNGSRLFA